MKKRIFSHQNIVKTVMILFDAFAVNFAYFIVLLIRYYKGNEFVPDASLYLSVFWKFAPVYAIICVAVFYFFKFYNTLWQFADIRDINKVLCACLITSCIQVAGTAFTYMMPFSYYLIGAVFQFIIIVGSRLAYKLYLMERDQVTASKGTVNAMVVGINGIGRFARKKIDQSSDKRTVCVVNSGNGGSNQLLNGVPVICGIENIEQIITSKNIGYVVIADENLSKEQVREIKSVCEKKRVEVHDFVEYLQNNNDSMEPVLLKSRSEGARVIPFSPPDISDKEIEEVRKALKSGWITTGPRTKELETKLAEFCHTSRVVCLNSATSAEELNFRVCGIGEGDEVIVPAYTYTATASAAIHCGAKVIFVDSVKDGFEMDYDKVASAITERTKVIVAVDLGGIVADYDKLYSVVENKRNLFKAKEGNDLGARIQRSIGRVLVFSDGAHALGAVRHGKMVGEIADFTDFSFHAVKNFTTAEGGASTWRDIEGIDNDEIYRQYQLYSLHGQSKDALAKTKLGAWEYDIVGPWYKCNMTDIMAAIGLKQFERYPGMIERRHRIIKKYDEMCDELGVMHLTHEGTDFRSSGHLYLTRIPGITPDQRQEIIVKLAEMGVATNVHYKPLPMMTAYKAYGWDIKDFPNAYNYYNNLITLPLHTCLTDEDIDYVIECYKKVVREYI